MIKPLALVALIGASACTKSYETVDAVTSSPEDFDGETVRLRGWAQVLVTTTVKACVPATCDCNGSSAQLVLTASPDIAPGDDRIAIAGAEGSGNECSYEVGLFDPSAVAYELVGRVEVQSTLPELPPEVRLTDIDLDESSELSGEGELGDLDASPLSVGAHLCACPTGPLPTCSGSETSVICSPI